MRRALLLLTCGAFLTLVVEATDMFRAPAQAVWSLGFGAVFAVLAIVGFAWVQDRGPRLAAAYLAVQIPLAMAMFVNSHMMVGGALLMVVLVMQTVLLWSFPAALGLIAITPLGHISMPLTEALRASTGTIIATVFGAVLTERVLHEQRARDELATAHAQLRGYAAQAEELAATQERNRLARDIHDGLGHHLTVVQMQLKAARAVLRSDTDNAEALLAKAQRQAQEALAEVRRSVSALREPAAARPIAEGLQELAAESSAAGVSTTLEIVGDARTLPAEAEETLYRTAQEGLTNVRKHANATDARLVLDYQDAEAVALEVRDDGKGAQAEDGPALRFGLLGLRERAARLGGTLDIDSAPGRGLTLRVKVPG